jgi:exodeoxyribonuclease X
MIPSHSLQALRYRFELDCNVQGDAHRAMFDTELVRALVEHVTVSGLVDSSNWSELVSFAQSPLEVLVFPFGKYRGKLVEDVAAQDRDYVSWLLRQEWVPKDYPDLYHTMLEKTTSKEMKK